MSIVEFLEANNCCPSLVYYGPNDWATGIELREIIDHPDIFDTLFQAHPLTTMSSTDDILLYMLAEKCVALMPRTRIYRSGILIRRSYSS